MVAISTTFPARHQPIGGARTPLTVAPPVTRRPRRPATVYRLRRLGALLALTLVLAAGALVADAAFGALSATPTGTARPVDAEVTTPPATLVVQPGDTLWSIAVEIAPDADPRAVVDELVDLNGSASIQVGQRLVLP